MKDQQNKHIEAYHAANQRYLFNFTVKLVFLTCICALMYGVFGDSMAGFFEQPEVISEEVQKKNRQKRKAARASAAAEDFDRVEDGIHVQTGLVFADGFQVVRGTCTGCHSAKLVTQNRATRDGWQEMIRWMQKTQGLWDLGKNEPIILDYLAKYYAPKEVDRRPGLDVEAIEWYILDLPQG